MERYTSFILKHRKMIIVVFVFLAVVCAGLSTKVGVNYKFADYLPDDAASTVALDTMKKEYSQPVPNMRVVIHNVTIPQALDYKKKLEQADGVDEVNWLDDVVDIYEPLENADQDTIDEWYKDSDALYSITVVDDETEKRQQLMRSVTLSGMTILCQEQQSQMHCHRSTPRQISRRSCCLSFR